MAKLGCDRTEDLEVINACIVKELQKLRVEDLVQNVDSKPISLQEYNQHELKI